MVGRGPAAESEERERGGVGDVAAGIGSPRRFFFPSGPSASKKIGSRRGGRFRLPTDFPARVFRVFCSLCYSIPVVSAQPAVSCETLR